MRPATSSRIARFLAACAISAAGIAPCVAGPLLSAPPGQSTFAFDVAAVHPAGLNPATGAFVDVFTFSLASDASLAATALYFGDEIEGFSAQLSGAGGLNRVGINTALGAGTAFLNGLFADILAAGDYEIRVSGNDVFRDTAAPYSLTLAVGPQTRAIVHNVAEPAAQALLLAALCGLAWQRQRPRCKRAMQQA